jgi:TnpA family transposase
MFPHKRFMRTLQVEERPSRLALAIAEVGRIDKTIHTLNFIDDETRRRGPEQICRLRLSSQKLIGQRRVER